MTHSRTRTAAIAGSMALSMSLALAPAAMAQDGPDAPMNEVLTAFSEGRFADATVPFCSAMEATALGGIGQLDEMMDMGAGMSLGLIFDALHIDTDGLDVVIADEGDDTAVLDVSGVIDVGIDEDGLVALVSVMLAEGGEPLDEDMVRGLLPMMQAQIDEMLGGTVEVDEEVQVILEDGVWQVCDDLQSIGEALAGAMGTPTGGAPDEPDMSDEGMGDDDMSDDDTSEDGMDEEEAGE
jgi:hypothetical protein